MSYLRVIPRDLFNEAKLLKCLGRVCLFIYYAKLPGLESVLEDEESGFKINQNNYTGDFYIENLYFFDENGTPVHFYTKCNAKDNYPLMMEYKGQEYIVFDEIGSLLIDKYMFKGELC